MKSLNGAGLLIIALIGSFGLFRFAGTVATQRQECVPKRIGEELLLVRAPQRLIDFATKAPVFENHDALQKRIREEKLEHAWYAITTCVYLDDGSRQVSTAWSRVGEQRARFLPDRYALDILAGRPFDPHDVDVSHRKLAIMPERFVTQNPFEALKELEQNDREAP